MPFVCFPVRSPSKASKTPTEVVFVLGGPGSGKGTQCARIVTEFGYVHLSAGDLLRAERAKKDSKNGQLIENCIKEGTLVPAEIIMALLKGAIESNAKATGAQKFLIDGFPRSKDNLDGWEKSMKGVQIEFVLFLDCDEKVMEERLINRGQTSGRADDNAETIKKRFNTYQESTKPIVEHFADNGKLRRISANSSVDEVFAEIKLLFKPQKVEGSKDQPAKSDPPIVVDAVKSEPQAEPEKQATEPQAEPEKQATEPQAEPEKQSTGPQAEPEKQSTGLQAEPEKQSTGPQAEPENQATEPQAEPEKQAIEPDAEPEKQAEVAAN